MERTWPPPAVPSARPVRPARARPGHRRPTSLLEQVGVARQVSSRNLSLLRELAKFGVVGVLAVVIADVGTNLLHFQFGLGALMANVIATIVSTVVSYVGNRYWTFRDRQRTTVRREGLLFFVLNGIGLGIQLACLGVCTYVLGWHDKLSYNVFLIIGISLATAFRYVAYKKWVWQAAALQ
jgi:putative flippase GtrA